MAARAHSDIFEHAGIRPDGIIQNVRVYYNNELGRGSDAAVYGGTWRAPRADVAVKVLHPTLTEPEAGGREVFLRKYGDECNRLQNLRHDNVVKFLGVTRSREDTPALVTERMDTTLRHCSQTTELSLLEQLDILCDASAGLAYLHSRGVVHRDLTTRNVLLTTPPNRRAKLADVGLSRSLHGNWWFLNYGAALTRCPGTMLYMPPEALVERPAYDERLDSFSFGVLMMAVVLRLDPSTASFQSARERILPDGSSRVIPEVERRASDLNAIPPAHPLLDLIKQCLNNDPKRRPSARSINENLHDIRTRRFPDVRRKRETDHCLDCDRSNRRVAQLEGEVSTVWSRLEHHLQANLSSQQRVMNEEVERLRSSLNDKDSTIEDLRARLTEAENTSRIMRRREEDLSARLTEAEDASRIARRHEEDANTRAHNLEERILHERESATRERNLLTAQLEQASSEVNDKIEAAVFLDRVRQYNRDLKQAESSASTQGVKSPFGEWQTVHTNLPDDVFDEFYAAVHSNFLYITLRSKSLGCRFYRSQDKTSWTNIQVPPNMFSSRGLVNWNNRLFCLFEPALAHDPGLHLVLFELITEENGVETTSWKQLPNGRCPIRQTFPALCAVDHKLVMVGGKGGKDSLSAVSEYCLQTNQWITPSTWPRLPKPVQQLRPVWLGKCLCFFGGKTIVNNKFTEANKTVFSVKVENGKPSGEFDSISLPPSPFGNCAASRVNQTAVVAGGWNGCEQDGVFLFDSSSQDWLKMPSLNKARYYAPLVAFEGSLLCIGGCDADDWFTTIEELSVSVTPESLNP